MECKNILDNSKISNKEAAAGGRRLPVIAISASELSSVQESALDKDLERTPK